MSKNQRIAVDLSPAKERVIGRELEVTELGLEQLEERVAPLTCSNGGHFPEAK
jgi:hypothetical protein